MRFSRALLVFVALAGGTTGVALPAVAAPVLAPGFNHKPARGLEAGEPYLLEVQVNEPKKVRRGRVRYRVQGEGSFQKLDLRLTGKTLRATIPASSIKEPALEYYVVVQTDDGRVVAVVAKPGAPLRVPVEALPPMPTEPAPKPPPPEAAKTTPAKEKPAKESPAKETPAKETPAKETPAKETPAKEKPAKEKPAKETPAKESAADGGVEPDAASDESASADPLADGVDEAELSATAATRRGANVEGRRLPGGARPLDAEGDPFLVELAVWAAEDPASFVIDPSAVALVRAAPTDVIGRERIERMGARTLLDVLQVLPGVSVSRDVSGFWQVSVRGLRGDSRLLVLLDGQPFHNPYDGRVMWSLPADMIERVELVRTAHPGAARGPALAGVLRVTTRREPGANLRLVGGSFTTVAGGGGAALKLGGFSLFGSGYGRYTEGPLLAVEEDSFTRTPFIRASEDLVTDAGEVNVGLALGTELDLSGTRLYARGRGFLQSRGAYLGAFDTLGPDSELTWITGGGAAGVDVALGDFGHIDIGAYGDVHSLDRLWQVSPPKYFTEDRDGDGDREDFESGVLVREAYTSANVGARLELGVSVFAGNEVTAGFASEFGFIPAEGYALAANRSLDGVALGGVQAVPDLVLGQNGPCPVYGTSLDALGACRLTTSLYVGDAWQVFPGFYVDGGLAFSSFSDVELDLLTHTNPQLGLSWTLFDRLTLRANAATGVRPPTWAERLDQRSLPFIDFSAGAYVGNPALIPEAVRIMELGADYRFELGDAKYRVWGSSWARNVSDAIDRIDLNGNVESPSNAGGYDTLGAEGGGEARFAGGSTAWVNVSWFRTWFRAAPDLDPDQPVCVVLPFEAGEPCGLVTDEPQLRTNLGLHFDLGVLDLNTWAVVGAERRNNARTTLEQLRPYTIQPYALVNMTARTKPLFGLVGVEASVFNLLNTAHKDAVPRPDRITGLVPREGVAVYGGAFLEL